MEPFPEHKFSVVIEEVDFPQSPGSTNVHEKLSSCDCIKEIKYLKETVKQLISQVNKQNHQITGIKSSLRNAVLSLSSCYTEDKNGDGDGISNQYEEYANDQQLNTASELETNFEDQLQPQQTNYNILDTPCNPIEDPLQDVTTCSSILIENCISEEEVFSNDPIIIPSSSQAIIVENELNDEDDEEIIDEICENEDDDELYTPSEVDLTSDQDLDTEDVEKQNSSSEINKVAKNSQEEGPINSGHVFRCKNCPKKFTCKTRRTFRDHMRRYHSKDPHKCHLCEKAYVKKSSLAHHIHSVHKGNRLKCAYCPGSFVQLGKLRVHEKIHLIKDGPPLQCCEFCGMNFRTVKSLLAHLGAMHKDTDHKHYAIGVKAIKNTNIKRKK